MNWDDLKLFLDVSRRRKLDDAAAQTHLDATTISRRIKRLEQDLGVTLFERTRRGHVLTVAGEKLVARVEAMETASLDILAESTTEQSAEGRIRLGVTEGLGSTVIAPALGRFKQVHPKIDIDLIALSGFVSVPKRQADMSILLARPSTGRLKVRKLTDYSLHLYGTARYLADHSQIRSRDDLQAHTLIGYVDDLIYSAQLHYFDELLPGLTPQLCSPSIVAQVEMVSAGAGLGILPTFMADRFPGLVNLLPDDICVTRTFWLAIHEDVAGLTRNRAMSDFLVETLARLP
ncbi:LysR family transcriptional regulator [Henriciella aquimarina]|uniref:LysR family transcriptional regulator n=1 Tax=Henriciella aquimarina TaxID=545261 RepID=UPI000A02777C|nr:LysR family transcriptional regulator [Henriciella aquimarina]